MLSNCPLGYKDLREYADALLDFLNKYQFLWKHNAVDFYVNDYWNNEFPKEWRILEQNSFQSLLSLASCGLVQVLLMIQVFTLQGQLASVFKGIHHKIKINSTRKKS